MLVCCTELFRDGEGECGSRSESCAKREYTGLVVQLLSTRTAPHIAQPDSGNMFANISSQQHSCNIFLFLMIFPFILFSHGCFLNGESGKQTFLKLHASSIIFRTLRQYIHFSRLKHHQGILGPKVQNCVCP